MSKQTLLSPIAAVRDLFLGLALAIPAFSWTVGPDDSPSLQELLLDKCLQMQAAGALTEDHINSLSLQLKKQLMRLIRRPENATIMCRAAREGSLDEIDQLTQAPNPDIDISELSTTKQVAIFQSAIQSGSREVVDRFARDINLHTLGVVERVHILHAAQFSSLQAHVRALLAGPTT